ncbi:MAG: diguanylate cyclase [Bacillota bacterium]
MKSKFFIIIRHFVLNGLLFGMVFLTWLYFTYFNKTVSVFALIALQLSALFTWMFLFHNWYMRPHLKIVNRIRDYYSVVDSKKDSSEAYVSSETELAASLEKIVTHYEVHEKQQEELLNQLRHNNALLERSNRLTKAMMEITNNILSSGDLDLVLQNILKKAIEIIPCAQKGSILLYNGEHLEFKAVYGYDFEVLKNFKFDITECFQYKTNNFYQPVIIKDVETFNRSLNEDKFNTLKDSRSFEIKSVISCAISVDSDFLGIINIDSVDNLEAFGEEDKPLIKHLAEQMGIALKNAKLLEKILYLSRHDSLTGIFNRSYFEELFEKAYNYTRQRNHIFSLVAFDINDLKHTNDTYGHEAGDSLIKSFVNIIANHVQKPDIFARTGGDEFFALYLDKDLSETRNIIEAYKKDFENTPFNYDGRELFKITFGHGIAVYPSDTVLKKELLSIADTRMYSDKKVNKCNI